MKFADIIIKAKKTAAEPLGSPANEICRYYTTKIKESGSKADIFFQWTNKT